MSENELLINLINKIKNSDIEHFTIMEICGTHTQSIAKMGIRKLLHQKVNLVSGPGCPVCVTSEGYIDAAIELLNRDNIILVTFGDLMKVWGTKENLIEQREKGKKINIVYSPLDALKIAEENKSFEVVFLAVGFETTVPLIGLTVKKAKENNINNFSILSSLKVMKPILHKILKDENCKIQGIICPGHVAVITGADYFKFIKEKYNIASVVSGFESLDIISSIYFLIKQNCRWEKKFENLYRTCVTPNGNLLARRIIKECFFQSGCMWRGIGKIEKSGLYLNRKYEEFDAVNKFKLAIEEKNKSDCICSEIILGKKFPYDCEFFGGECIPESPVGPCMVSSEGPCSIYYKYGGYKK
ncbi:hydrogenase formation protein HypD [Clostridium sp. WILCCON 0269]|uniref:Hydrogenase formation protein HypD n=1 Tax=Candidatus Clostridium eludens TaxID=3381663 RepID=A0ABW8SGW6_9CLOT